VKHQREAGVPYFDAIATAVGATSTTALEHSTETDQF
jgi:isocitrate lyase